MKAKLPKQSELVLLYGLDENSEKGSTVLGVLKAHGYPTKLLSPGDLGQTLGHLADLPGFPPAQAPYDGEPQEGELLVMKGLVDARMDELLKSLRESGAGPIPLKAVLTPTHQHWQLHALMQEVGRESRVMEAFRRLREVAGNASQIPMPPTPDLAWDRLQRALSEAATLVQSQEEPTERGFLDAAQAIEEAVANLLDR